MKKELTLSGPAALFALSGLLSLHALPGFSSSGYCYVTDVGIAVLLLAFSDQILLTVLLVLVQAAQQLNRVVSLIKTDSLRASQYAQVAVQPKKMRPSGTNLNPLLVAVLLISVGTLSPSDGVDSGRHLPTVELLSRALLILVAGVGCFLVYLLWHEKKMGGAEIPEPQPEAERANADSPVLETMV